MEVTVQRWRCVSPPALGLGPQRPGEVVGKPRGASTGADPGDQAVCGGAGRKPQLLASSISPVFPEHSSRFWFSDKRVLYSSLSGDSGAQR